MRCPCLRALPRPASSTTTSPWHRHGIHSSRPPQARVLSSSSLSWAELASSLSGRDRVEARKREMEEKYGEQLKRKVHEQGVEGLEELKERAALGRKLEAKKTAELARAALARAKAQRVVSTPPPAPPSSSSSSPIKPLDAILDLTKLRTQSSTTVSQLWNAYHLQRADKLSAVIPVATYDAMVSVAKKYPSFVVPLPRKGAVVAAQEESKDEAPVEMQYLQWSFLPPPEPAPSTESSPPPTSVLFTPLGEFKLRQAFAQPTLVLSHYTDLASSHGIVLMRGEVTPNVGGKLAAEEAQLLVFRLQQFFHWSGAATTSGAGTSKDADRVRQRQELLQTFHERPSDFSVEALVETSRDV